MLEKMISLRCLERTIRGESLVVTVVGSVHRNEVLVINILNKQASGLGPLAYNPLEYKPEVSSGLTCLKTVYEPGKLQGSDSFSSDNKQLINLVSQS